LVELISKIIDGKIGKESSRSWREQLEAAAGKATADESSSDKYLRRLSKLPAERLK